MQTEYEATFLNIDKEHIRNTLKNAGAALVRPEFKQVRVTLDLPHTEHTRDTWMRVRDEGDKVTMTWKSVTEGSIESQKEISLIVNNFNDAVELLEKIGCIKKSYQESTRELWTLDDVEITIDTWPFLEAYVEVEGPSEEAVRTISQKLGFDWNDAHFASAGKFFKMKYGEQFDIGTMPRLTFDMQNPFT